MNTFLSLLTAQTLVTIFLAALLWSLYRHLQRQEFNRWWAWAWTSSAVFLFVARIAVTLDAPTLARGALVLLATMAGFLTVPLLAFGVLSFRSSQPIAKKLAIAGLGTALGVGALTFASSLLWLDPVASFSVRQGARTLALGAILLFCARVFFERARTTWSWAATITGSSCLIYGLNQLFFAFTLLRAASATAFAGVADRSMLNAANLIFLDVAFTAGICLGMVLLLIEEHQRAERALSESVDRGRAVSEENAVLQAEISKRQLAEQELRRSEEKFASAFRCSPCAMTITSVDGGGSSTSTGASSGKWGTARKRYSGAARPSCTYGPTLANGCAFTLTWSSADEPANAKSRCGPRRDG